ncbi:hypothetical protein BJP36_35615 [Moorena producens JHB]|uniref:Uncharacterized protein n=1 Tax=Moorena producens (strain JHB) TaxID=1454205 RepID=A0A9Q9UW29_MOOP1|nr:hypothetical protein [Moorena producens]WAN69421.1 hypothetical protein BJP36_35615 [Moorena producens JHB]
MGETPCSLAASLYKNLPISPSPHLPTLPSLPSLPTLLPRFPIPDSRFPFPSWEGLGVGSDSRFPIPDSLCYK